jgi:hypothetical protein
MRQRSRYEVGDDLFDAGVGAVVASASSIAWGSVNTAW